MLSASEQYAALEVADDPIWAPYTVGVGIIPAIDGLTLNQCAPIRSLAKILVLYRKARRLTDFQSVGEPARRAFDTAI